MLLDLLRLTIAWGAICAVTALWYWIMRNIGTF